MKNLLTLTLLLASSLSFALPQDGIFKGTKKDGTVVTSYIFFDLDSIVVIDQNSGVELTFECIDDKKEMCVYERKRMINPVTWKIYTVNENEVLITGKAKTQVFLPFLPVSSKSMSIKMTRVYE